MVELSGKGLIGEDLRNWRVETWFELRLSTDENGGYEVAGYFRDKDLANATGKGKSWYGGDGKVEEVLVLTNDGAFGFVVGDDRIYLSDQNALKATAVEKAKAKLTPEERKLLGIE
jgi:hypothetical protein